MEKIAQSQYHRVNPLTLYREDIEQILEIMQNAGLKTSLSTDKFQLASGSELANLTDRIQELRIKGTLIRDEWSSQSIALTFSHNYASCTIDDSENNVRLEFKHVSKNCFPNVAES